jgi:hypothetical protein
MRPLESWGRWCTLGVIAALLFLPLLSAGAEATRPAMQEARPMLSSDATMQATPSVMDCVPCVHCYVAPAPPRFGFSGDCIEPESPWQHMQARARPDLATPFDTGRLRTRLSVRIEYCRWLV